MNSENRQVGGNDCMSRYSENANSCGCCCAGAPQPPAMNPCTIPKFEPRNLPQHICNPKACVYFGSHDINTRPICGPPHRTHYRMPKSSEFIGEPIGLVKASAPSKGSDSQKYATCLKAFAKLYLITETDWTTVVVDQLLKEGQQLYQESQKVDPDAVPEPASDIYTAEEDKIKRAFEIDGCSFQVELHEKFQLEPPVEQTGDVLTPDLTLKKMREALRGFFRKSKYCLAKVGNLYLVIWKSRGVYFVFDCCGRKLADLMTDRDKGLAMLICLQSVDNVKSLIRLSSGISLTDTFSLRELKVVKLVGLDGKTMNCEFGKRINQFDIISDDYALLRPLLHLSLNREKALQHRSALPVAVATLLATKIDHPATWTQKVLDKIICYGVGVCRCCWAQCLGSKDPVMVEQFPTQLRIGQFWAGYTIQPRVYQGTWRCVPNQFSELSVLVERFFESGEHNLIVQVDDQFYAVWKKNNFIYFLDPYRHRIMGTKSTQKSASLRMFRSMEYFNKHFNQVLLESNKMTNFMIHTLHVKSLSLVDKTEGVPQIEPFAPDQEDVRSLNETICFEQDESKCLEELGEISDYEDEEIIPDVVAVEPKSDASADEEMEEEEGEEEGMMDDLSELETSSSDEDGKHKKKLNKKKGGGGGGNRKPPSKKEPKKKEEKKDDKKKTPKEKKEKKVEKPKDDKDKDKGKKDTSKDKKDDKSKDKPKKDDKDKKDKDDKGKKDKDDKGDKGDKGKKDKDDKDKGGKGKDTAKKTDKGKGKDEASDEDDDIFKGLCKPNNYPGYSTVAHDMAVVGSETGSYESLCKLLRAGFKCADRILTMTPWGNYVVFRGYNLLTKVYFVFDGCTCNVNRFRHLDLNCGTAGLLCFPNLHDVISYILDSRTIRTNLKKSRKNIVDEICRQYCK